MRDQQAAQDEIGAPDEKQHDAIQRDGPRGEMRFRHPARDEGHEGQPEQQMQVRPQDETVHAMRGLEQMVVVVPVDADEHEAQHVAQEHRGHRAQRIQAVSGRRLSSSTMMVMMMAMTPSLNASSLPLPIPGLVYGPEGDEVGARPYAYREGRWT